MKTSRSIFIACVCALALAGSSRVCAQSAVRYPAGGEEIVAGSSQIISWDTKLVTGMLSLALWDGVKGKWRPIWNNVPSEEGKVTWAVPQNLEGNKFRVKLTTTGTMSGSALTRTFFTIKQPAPAARVESVDMRSMGIAATVHPNPATNVAHICIEELPEGVPAVVEVVNDRGEAVTTLYDATPSGDLGLCLTLDCSKLPSGTYYAHVQNALVGRSVKLQVIK
jgi:hypothetical protein